MSWVIKVIGWPPTHHWFGLVSSYHSSTIKYSPYNKNKNLTNTVLINAVIQNTPQLPLLKYRRRRKREKYICFKIHPMQYYPYCFFCGCAILFTAPLHVKMSGLTEWYNDQDLAFILLKSLFVGIIMFFV